MTQHSWLRHLLESSDIQEESSGALVGASMKRKGSCAQSPGACFRMAINGFFQLRRSVLLEANSKTPGHVAGIRLNDKNRIETSLFSIS